VLLGVIDLIEDRIHALLEDAVELQTGFDFARGVAIEFVEFGVVARGE
jgi:hypothetical protein